MVLFIMLHKVVFILSPVVDEFWRVTSMQMKAVIQMKGEQYFPVVMFIMLYKVVQTFDSVNEILKCDHSNESY